MHENQRQPETDDLMVELRDLLASLEANELTDQQDKRIQEIVVQSEKARRFYLRYIFMYGTIHQKQNKFNQNHNFTNNLETRLQGNSPSSNHAIFPLLDMENDILSSSDGTVNELGVNKPTNYGNFFGHINFSFVPSLITIISAALILSTLVIIPIYLANRSDDPRWSVVARITKSIDCDWVQGAEWSQEGAYLTAGQLLDLKTGLAEIEFSSGAKVVLQGPTRFVTAGRNDSRLDAGKLAAVVPPRAKGFTVRTAGMEVVDLGTEFGVSVDANNKTDVHVFKGTIEMEAETKSGDTKTIQLTQNEAVEYEKTSGDIVRIPVNTQKFVRDIETSEGITTNLKIVNPGFETPNIRTVPEFQPEHGDTLSRAIDGWKRAGYDQKSRTAMYQISPYTQQIISENRSPKTVGPGATEGQQVAVLSLGMKSLPTGKPRSNWLYQSLGIITPADIGKTLKLQVDAGPRQGKGDNLSKHGTIFVSFALNVTTEQPGTVVGEGTLQEEEENVNALKTLEATFPITVELVGQEVYIVLAVSDDGSTPQRGQYHFDNVRISVEN